MKELKETIADMTSTDYKRRMEAEYDQLKIRFNELITMLEDWDNGTLSFTPKCPRGLYESQLDYMIGYMLILSSRLKIESMPLELNKAIAELGEITGES